MRLLINIHVGETIPRGYGFAYHGSYSDTSYCAPIPLNFVIGAWHNFYWYCLVRGWFDQSPLIGVQNYWRGKGFSEGETYGYEKGFQHSCALVEKRPVTDADRAGGIIGRSYTVAYTDDPCRTSRGDSPSQTHDIPPVEGEVSEGPQA